MANPCNSGDKGWNVNDPFTTLPRYHSDFEFQDLVLVYYTLNCAVLNAPKGAKVSSFSSPRKRVQEPSTLTDAMPEEKYVNFNLLGAVRLAVRDPNVDLMRLRYSFLYPCPSFALPFSEYITLVFSLIRPFHL